MRNISKRQTFMLKIVKLVIITAFAIPGLAHSQVDCLITVDSEIPVCHGQTITLSVAKGENNVYLWSPGGETTSFIKFKATEATSFTVTVTDTLTGEACYSAPFLVEVYPPFRISFEQMQLTCTNGDNDNGNTAMMKATALGESGPYVYEWNVRPTQIAPSNPSLAIGLKAHQKYFINVTDINGCSNSDSVYTKAYSNATVEIKTTPDTAYIQNPYVTFEFENLSIDTVQILSHFWEFGDKSPRSVLEAPVHVYTEVGDYQSYLTVYNQQGCDTVYFKEVKVLPIKLQIPNIITPNGDNVNDVFIITEAPASDGDPGVDLKSASTSGGIKPLSAYYKRTTLVIFNRQGRKVYESSNYNNDWGGDGLKDGVYFYVLQCEGFKNNEVYRGSVTIMGSSN